MQINVLGACSGLGQKLSGLELTPDLIRQNGFIDILEKSKVQFADLGNVTPYRPNDIWGFLAQLKEKVAQHISDDQLIFTLGGDHSIAIATVAATLEKYPDTRVVWIDAHGDINTPASSMTGNLHGMPLAALLGLFKNNISDSKLKKENLILIGIRDLDPFEEDLIASLNITVIYAYEIISNPGLALKKMTTWLNSKSSPLHVSFDIDSIDPESAPATGLRVRGGINKEFTMKLVNLLEATKKVVAIDLVELNANQVHTSQELNSTLEFFYDILRSFILSKK